LLRLVYFLAVETEPGDSKLHGVMKLDVARATPMPALRIG